MNVSPLDAINTDVVACLREYAAASEEARTPILRRLAALLADAREHHLRPDGTPDWKGRSYPYRRFVGDAYAEAGIPADDQPTIQAATRYHVGEILRKRLDADTLAAYGLSPGSPRDKARERRESRTELLNTLTAREAARAAATVAAGPPNPDEGYQIVVTHRAVHDAIIRALGPNAVLAPMPSAEDDLPTYGVVPRVVVEASSFTCPSCGRTSYHPEDVANGYCGACHTFTGTPGARA